MDPIVLNDYFVDQYNAIQDRVKHLEQRPALVDGPSPNEQKLASELAGLRQDLAALRAEKDALDHQCSDLRRAGDESQQRLAAAQSLNAQSAQRIGDLERQNGEHQRSFGGAEKRIAELTKQAEQLQAKRIELESEVARLVAELEKAPLVTVPLNSPAVAVCRNCASLVEEKRGLEQEVTTKASLLEGTQYDLKVCGEENDRLYRETDRLYRENKRLQQENDRLQGLVSGTKK